MKERMLLLDKIEPVDNLIKNSNNIYELTELAISSNDNEMEAELESECLELQKVFEENQLSSANDYVACAKLFQSRKGRRG